MSFRAKGKKGRWQKHMPENKPEIKKDLSKRLMSSLSQEKIDEEIRCFFEERSWYKHQKCTRRSQLPFYKFLNDAGVDELLSAAELTSREELEKEELNFIEEKAPASPGCSVSPSSPPSSPPPSSPYSSIGSFDSSVNFELKPTP